MFKCWFDGSCEPNPGGIIGWGYEVYEDGAFLFHDWGIYTPKEGAVATNNVAEYSALGHLLWALKKQEYVDREIKIFGDSKLVINQMRGEWGINGGAYETIALDVRKLAQEFLRVEYEWVPRLSNHKADELSRKAVNGH